MENTFNEVKTVPSVSGGSVYVIIAENDDLVVAVKPEAGLVYFDNARRFFQIGFRIHVQPKEGKTLAKKSEVQEYLNIGRLQSREDAVPRYTGQVRIPACDTTLSPWVVQEHITQGKLIEKLVDGLCGRLSEVPGLTLSINVDNLLELSKERFLDMIPDNKKKLPEVKVYFGNETYYPDEKDHT